MLWVVISKWKNDVSDESRRKPMLMVGLDENQ